MKPLTSPIGNTGGSFPNSLRNVGGSQSTQETPMAQVTVTLSAAQIITLHSAPVTLIPAPGARNAIAVSSIVQNFHVGSNFFSSSSGTPTVTVEYGSTGVAVQPSAGSYEGNTSEISIGPNSPLPSGGGGTNVANIANQPIVLSATHDFDGGAVAGLTVGAAAGTGYAHGDTGTITTGGDDANYVVDTVGGGGNVLTLHVDPANTGDSYTVSNNNATHVLTGGGDGNLTVDITSITQGNGSVTLTITYQILNNVF